MRYTKQTTFMVIRYYVDRDDAYEIHDVKQALIILSRRAKYCVSDPFFSYSCETKSNTSFSWLFAFSAISTGSLILTLPLPGWKYTKTLSYVY